MIAALKARWATLKKNGFVRSAGALAGGTALAQAIVVLATPLLTRLYSPTDFSTLAVYSAILAIFSSVACLRFEIAIPLPARDEDAANLLALALIGPAILGLLMGLAVSIWPDQIVELIKQPALRSVLWLLPLGVWLAGSYAAAQYWATRKKSFGVIARTRMLQAFAGTGVQVGMGWIGLGPIGLLMGQLINGGAGTWGLLNKSWRKDRKSFLSVRWGRIKVLFKEYHRFPKYSALEALANSGGIQFPMILIAALVVGPEAGYLLLATRVMAAPIGLIGGAVAQVYLSNAPTAYRERRLSEHTLEVIEGLVRAGVGPLIFAGVSAPFLFPLIFGKEWQRAGELVAWMTPWFVMQFLASPVSMALHVTGNQRAALLLQLFGFILRVGFAAMGAAALGRVSEAYAISGFVFYSLYIAVIFKKISIDFSNIVAIFKRRWKGIVLWIAFGIFVSFIAS